MARSKATNWQKINTDKLTGAAKTGFEAHQKALSKLKAIQAKPDYVLANDALKAAAKAMEAIMVPMCEALPDWPEDKSAIVRFNFGKLQLAEVDKKGASSGSSEGVSLVG